MTKSKKRAFALAAHPDDIEFVMAGTLILLRRAGYELHYMTIANGCCGSTEYSATHTAEMRQREAIAAADSIDAEFHPCLVNDLEIFYDHDTLVRLSAVMRLLPGVRPDPDRPEVLVVDTRVARLYPLEIFHLFGFRKVRQVGNDLLVIRRRYDLAPPRKMVFP